MVLSLPVYRSSQPLSRTKDFVATREYDKHIGFNVELGTAQILILCHFVNFKQMTAALCELHQPVEKLEKHVLF